jgi:hypothetical protein
MKKVYVIVWLVGLSLLAACGPATARESGRTPEAADALANESAAATAPAATAGEEGPQAEVLAAASQVRQSDWTEGAEEPAVTIIEYGDFQ